MLNLYPKKQYLMRNTFGQRNLYPIKNKNLGLVRLALVQHPGKEIDLGDDSQRLHSTALILLSNDSGTVPLEKAVQHAERGVHSDLNEATAAGLRLEGILTLAEITGVGDHLGDLGEVEHNLGDGALTRCPAVSQSAKHVTQSDETHQLAAGGGEDGELIKSSVAHDLNGGLAGRAGCDGSNRLQAQSADLGIGQRVGLWLSLSCRGHFSGELGEQVVGGEPIIISELELVSIMSFEVEYCIHPILPWSGNF
jgi:hypothetical protein